MMKMSLVFLTSSIIATLGFSANEIAINSKNFEIDNINKLIVINENLTDINSRILEPSATISLDADYNLAEPVSVLEIGKAYKVTRTSSQVEYDLYLTELPIIAITTPNTIIDEPRVFANFRLIESDGTEIVSNIGIEYRGATSQKYPKKSYRIEFWEGEDDTTTKDVSLLGLRSDDDWNLQALYNEPLKIRSKTANDLWREINQLHYADKEPDAINGVRMKYTELFVNNQYHGVYCVGERIDRKQLKLKKYKAPQVRGELYKGVGWEAAPYWSCPAFDNNSDAWAGFEYKYPDEIKTDWQRLYDHVHGIIYSSNSVFEDEIESKIVISNAVDYFIFLNLIRATDNTGKNLYVAKYKENTPYFFVPWDLDGVFGTIWNGTREDEHDDILTNGLYRRLLTLSSFTAKLKKRWEDLRNNEIIDKNRLLGQLTDNYEYLENNGIYERESKKWEKSRIDFENLDYTQEWLTKRIASLDAYFSYNPTSIAEEDFTDFNISISSELLQIETSYNSSLSVQIFDMCGVEIKSELFQDNSSILIPLNDIPQGVYSVLIKGKEFMKSEKIIKH